MKYLFFFCSLISCQLVSAQTLGLSDYDKPELLLRLEAYEKQGGSFKALGFDGLNDKSFTTDIPLDVIPFASAEYFHIGFLTDFGRITDLSQAPIVLVNSAPFEKEYTVALAAENLKMFLAIVVEVETVHVADYLVNQEYMTRADYDEILYEMEFGLEEPPISKDEWIQNLQADRKKAIQYINMLIGDVQIDNIASYLNNLTERRKAAINIETVDGLGIVYPGSDQVTNSFNYEAEVTVERVENFLSGANDAERLKFYRDATTYATYGSSDTYLFDRVEKAEMKKLNKVIYNHLSKDGYEYEARVLKKHYK
ncbi:MAG: hypothetical protein ACFHWX_09200 [Bacteroidota bacterium]